MIRQYPDAEILIKMQDKNVQVTDVVYLEEYNTIEYGSESYYLTGVDITYTGSKNVYKLTNSKTFAECATNRTNLIDYLKEYQKG